jgi:hypothetical protein
MNTTAQIFFKFIVADSKSFALNYKKKRGSCPID